MFKKQKITKIGEILFFFYCVTEGMQLVCVCLRVRMCVVCVCVCWHSVC